MYSTPPTPLLPKRPDGSRIQLLVAYGLLSVLVATVAASALGGIATVRDTVHQVVAIDGQLSWLASDVATQALESRRYEKDFFLNVADPRAQAEYLAKWHTSVLALDQAIAAFAAAAPTPEDQQQAARWRTQAARYAKDFGQIARAVAEGHIRTSAAANEAFTPFKENIRILTESSAAVADRNAAREVAASAALDATGARTNWLVGLLAALAVLVAVGVGAADLVPIRRSCVDCNAWLPLRQWISGEHRCYSCTLRRLARLIDDAETRQRRKDGD